MQWRSLNEFLAMGGYGLYVWPSFGMTALCLLLEVVALRCRRAAVLKFLAGSSHDEGGRE